MELASLIEDLGKACGLELTLDEGRCTLRFDGEHDVTIERDCPTRQPPSPNRPRMQPFPRMLLLPVNRPPLYLRYRNHRMLSGLPPPGQL